MYNNDRPIPSAAIQIIEAIILSHNPAIARGRFNTILILLPITPKQVIKNQTLINLLWIVVFLEDPAFVRFELGGFL